MAKTGRKPKTTEKKSSYNNFFSQIRWGESYTSLILGAIVVLVAAVLLILFLKNANTQSKQTGSSSTGNENSKTKTYTVKEGEDLWHISENLYGSGYNWVDLAKENKISDPNLIESGTKLSIPKVVAKEPTEEKTKDSNKITESTYLVKEGDTLWDIAVRTYGDGYKWTDIAKANKLQNPDIIYVGTNLILAR